MINLNKLVTLLNAKYLNQYNTILKGGFEEPYYQAAHGRKCAEIQFTHDYIRSALHELSHWCVAGTERRKLNDYDYWYAADGRSQQQQNDFFRLEVKPQTIEWAFSIACGVKFEASIDNLNNSVVGTDVFKNKLSEQMHFYRTNGFSKRVDEIIKLIENHQMMNSEHSELHLG